MRFVPSTTPIQRASRPENARANSEIELLLALPIILTVLMMVAATLKIGTARVANIFEAQAAAFPDATTAATPQYTTSRTLSPITGFLGDEDTLPYRMHT